MSYKFIKKKERVGKEKRVRGRSSEALPVLHFIVSFRRFQPF
jgi:hypothetical protein